MGRLRADPLLGTSVSYRWIPFRCDPVAYSCRGWSNRSASGCATIGVDDLVAFAGNVHALHGDFSWVMTNRYRPARTACARNMLRLPRGTIALQVVRRGKPQLGAIALLIRLGLIRQPVVELCNTVGVRWLGGLPGPAESGYAMPVELNRRTPALLKRS